MSFIQANLNGKERGLKFNQLAVQTYLKNVDWDNPVEAGEVYALFYGGLIGNCYVKRETPDFTFEDVCDWVDTLYLTKEGKETIQAVSKVMTDTEQYKVILEGFKEQIRLLGSKGDKKKASKK